MQLAKFELKIAEVTTPDPKMCLGHRETFISSLGNPACSKLGQKAGTFPLVKGKNETRAQQAPRRHALEDARQSACDLARGPRNIDGPVLHRGCALSSSPPWRALVCTGAVVTYTEVPGCRFQQCCQKAAPLQSDEYVFAHCLLMRRIAKQSLSPAQVMVSNVALLASGFNSCTHVDN